MLRCKSPFPVSFSSASHLLCSIFEACNINHKPENVLCSSLSCFNECALSSAADLAYVHHLKKFLLLLASKIYKAACSVQHPQHFTVIVAS